jgi:hypothetical protein
MSGTDPPRFRVMQLIDGDECVVYESIATYPDACRCLGAAVRAAQSTVRPADFSIWEIGGGIVALVDPSTGALKRVTLKGKPKI